MSHTPPPLEPRPIRLAKRALLVVFGPIYFLAIGFVPLLCAHRAGFRGWYWRRVKRACARLLSLLSIRVEISPEDKTTLAHDENSLIVINHRSHLDGFTLMEAIPDRKWFTFAAKKELCEAALLRTGFKGAGLVEIDRKSGKIAMDTLTSAVRAMPARRSVVLFPEGTRVTSEALGPFKAGAIVVARATGRSIRPILITGSDTLLPRGRILPKSGVISLKVLPPFHCDLSLSVEADLARLHALMSEAFERASCASQGSRKASRDL